MIRIILTAAALTLAAAAHPWRKNRELELVTAEHTYERPGRYAVAVKVVDIFGNGTMTLVPVTVE